MVSEVVSEAAAELSSGTVAANIILTAGITFVCLVAFYFLRLIKQKPVYKFAMLAWCALAFLMLLIVNFAVRSDVVIAACSVAGGLAAGACVCIPIHKARRKNAPAEQAASATPVMDYTHFVAERLLNIGLHHVEFAENPEKDGYSLRAKDSYTQRVCVRCEFSPYELEKDRVEALAKARDEGKFKRAIFFTNTVFTDDARVLAGRLEVELIERFRAGNEEKK